MKRLKGEDMQSSKLATCSRIQSLRGLLFPIFDAIHFEESEDEEPETFDFKLLNTSECCEVEGEGVDSSGSTTGSARDS